MTLTMKGNLDPVFALRMHQRNMQTGAADTSDPTAMNMYQADLEQQLLESTYRGFGWWDRYGSAWTGSARALDQTDGVGRPADAGGQDGRQGR